MSLSMDTNKYRDQNSPVMKTESNQHFLKEGAGHDSDYKSSGDRSNLNQGHAHPRDPTHSLGNKEGTLEIEAPTIEEISMATGFTR